MQPIAVPAIPVEELKDITDNFGLEALIGEGSYGRVRYAHNYTLLPSVSFLL